MRIMMFEMVEKMVIIAGLDRRLVSSRHELGDVDGDLARLPIRLCTEKFKNVNYRLPEPMMLVILIRVMMMMMMIVMKLAAGQWAAGDDMGQDRLWYNYSIRYSFRRRTVTECIDVMINFGSSKS